MATDNRSLVASTAFLLYTRKPTSGGFLFVLDGGPVGIGAKTQTPTAQSTFEAELLVAELDNGGAYYLLVGRGNRLLLCSVSAD